MAVHFSSDDPMLYNFPCAPDFDGDTFPFRIENPTDENLDIFKISSDCQVLIVRLGLVPGSSVFAQVSPEQPLFTKPVGSNTVGELFKVPEKQDYGMAWRIGTGLADVGLITEEPSTSGNEAILPLVILLAVAVCLLATAALIYLVCRQRSKRTQRDCESFCDHSKKRLITEQVITEQETISQVLPSPVSAKSATHAKPISHMVSPGVRDRTDEFMRRKVKFVETKETRQRTRSTRRPRKKPATLRVQVPLAATCRISAKRGISSTSPKTPSRSKVTSHLAVDEKVAEPKIISEKKGQEKVVKIYGPRNPRMWGFGPSTGMLESEKIVSDKAPALRPRWSFMSMFSSKSSTK
jgi:hypothetical protein